MKKSIEKWNKVFALGLAVCFIGVGCKPKERSSATGWNYNDPSNGGFLKAPFVEQETGPGLVLVQGGTFTMGRVEQDVMDENHNTPRRVTVSSFYIDETEVTNQHWLDYLHWVRRTYTEYPIVYKKALPDTLVWRSKLAYNEPYVEYYLRHPAYRDYPVVGVSWLQANNYCAWRTDRVNEYILIREGIFNWKNDQQNEPYTTDAYMSGQYDNDQKNEKGQLKDWDPSNGAVADGKRIKTKDLATRNVKMEDGILLPRYRLPTEAEWEYAAYGLIGNTVDERITSRRIYPWDGHWTRNPEDKFQGEMLANFVRGRGDYMGVAGKLNDNADVTAPVYAYWPNDYGLYHMGGNVSEWVMDVYRPLSSEDFDEFRPFRGNVFKTKRLNTEGNIANKLEETMYDVPGIKEYLVDFRAERENRKGGVVTDSLDFLLLDELDSLVDQASELYFDGQQLDASIAIEDIIQTSIPNIAGNVQSSPGLDNFEFEMVPKILQGFSDFVLNTPGNLKTRNVTKEENLDRRNYQGSDYKNYMDGDLTTSIFYDDEDMINDINTFNQDNKTAKKHRPGYNPEDVAYQSRMVGETKPTSLIHDKSRVFKGGSWKDRAYFMNPGTRRYYDEFRSTDYIGFRCAMTRVGSPVGNNAKRK